MSQLVEGRARPMGRVFVSLLVAILAVGALRADLPTDVEVYVADSRARPGKIYQVGLAPYPQTRFERRAGGISALAVGPDGWFYFVDANDRFIFRTDGREEYEVHRHSTYIRDLAFDSAGRLYFSEATGAGGDGTIYRLSVDRSESRVYRHVPLREVEGFWSGNFAFESSGRLVVSSGNRRPAGVFRMQGRRFVRRYGHDRSIKGFSILGSGDLIFADFRHRLFRLEDFETRSLVYEDDRFEWLSDVAVSRPPSDSRCTIRGRLTGGDELLPLTLVYAKGPDLSWRHVEGVRPASNGTYVLSGLPAGRYWVLTDIRADTGADWEPDFRRIDCRGTVTGIDFVLR